MVKIRILTLWTVTTCCKVADGMKISEERTASYLPVCTEIRRFYKMDFDFECILTQCGV